MLETTKILPKFIQSYCAGIDIKFAISKFKVGSMFSVKDPVPIDVYRMQHLLYLNVTAVVPVAKLAEIL